MGAYLARVVIQRPEADLHFVEMLNLVVPVFFPARERPSEDRPSVNDVALIVRGASCDNLRLLDRRGRLLAGINALETGRYELIRNQSLLLGV